MDKNLQENVEAIATDVRFWAEGRASDIQLDLNGWCARASAELFRQLAEEGIQAEIHAWTSANDAEAHVYVVVDDHIVDVTATQYRPFRNTPIVVMHQREAEVHEFYRTVEVFHSVQDLRDWQKKNRWPPDQIAFH